MKPLPGIICLRHSKYMYFQEEMNDVWDGVLIIHIIIFSRSFPGFSYYTHIRLCACVCHNIIFMTYLIFSNMNPLVLDKRSSYLEIVHPRVIQDDFESRHRRSTSPSMSQHHKNLQYMVATKEKDFHLILTLNEGLISPGFVLERRSSSNVSRTRFQPAYERHRHCSYHGMVRGHANSQVAVNVCRGLVSLF